MKMKLAILALVLLVFGASRADAQYYRHSKKYYKTQTRSSYYRPTAVIYLSSGYKSSYHRHYVPRYRYYRHMPPGHAKKYYKHRHHKHDHYKRSYHRR